MKSVLLLTIILMLNSCCKTWRFGAKYQVTGTKTNVTIKYRNVNKDDSQSREYTTIIVDKLPWEIDISASQSSCKDKLPWFLSAYSDSEGEMTVYINYSFSNFTTNNYVELLYSNLAVSDHK